MCMQWLPGSLFPLPREPGDEASERISLVDPGVHPGVLESSDLLYEGNDLSSIQ